MVTHEKSGRGRRLPVPGRLHSPQRRIAGPVIGLIAPMLLTLLCTQLRSSVNTTSDILLFLLAVVGTACLGGVVSALVASFVASLLLNYYFIPPIHRFTISDPNNVLALVVFAVVAIIVANIVDRATRLARRAARATAEAETLSAVAGSVLRGDRAVPALLARLRETFGMDRVALVRRDGAGGDQLLATVGEEVEDHRHGTATEEVSVGGDALLLLNGRPLPAADRRVLTAFAAHVGAALERERMALAVAGAEPIGAANQARAALLEAVSHDLRDPLSVAVAAVTSLDSHDIVLPEQDRQELFGDARAALDSLTRLTDDLSDLGRLHTGSLTPELRAVSVAECFAGARESLGEARVAVGSSGLDEVPAVLADPGLLQRILANLLENALLRTADGAEIQVSAGPVHDRVEIRVADRGPWSPATDRDGVFDPFPPRSADGGGARRSIRLPLALSLGFAESMGGTLLPEDTPGGGLTMALTLPAAPAG